MKRYFTKSTPTNIALYSIVFLFILSSCQKGASTGEEYDEESDDTTAAISVITKEGFVLTMIDEFNGSNLNTDLWTSGLPANWNTISLNNEEQGYSPDNLIIKGGILKIKMEEREVIGTKNGTEKTFNYASGCLNSKGKFHQTYGLFELRAKLPGGEGTWPAYWLMPENENIWSPIGAEIDIFEHFTVHGSDIQTGIYYDGYGSEMKHWKEMINVPEYDSEYHTYTCEWRPDRISIYIDGKPKATYNKYSVDGGVGIPCTDEYIIINAAMGGYGGKINIDTLPGYLEIDYVKIYQFQDTAFIGELERERFAE